MEEYPLSVPVIDTTTGQKSYRVFEQRKDFITYIKSIFKNVGEYEIENSDGYWNSAAKYFSKNGFYCNYVTGTVDFKNYWELEKEKCKGKSGVIFISGNKEFFVTGFYYFYLNFFLINDKVKNKLDFPSIYDSDYHFFLHILLCLLLGKHSVILKKRQWGSSFKHAAILLNNTWFGNAAKNKIFAQDTTHVKNTWIFLTDARDHLNTHTGWKRQFQPDSVLDWEQKWKTQSGAFVGNKSVLKGLSTEKDASKPVGGGISFMFGEEAGINDTLDITHQYALPAVSMGAITTGLLMYAGSVGELDRCEPLKKFMLSPDENGFLGYDYDNVESEVKRIGFFAPEWWNYLAQDEDGNQVPCYDKWGNTDKKKALEYIHAERAKAKKSSPEDYRYYCSQRPLTLEEAFAWRKDSIFPAQIIQRQMTRIDNDDKGLPVRLYRDADGKIKHQIISKEKSKVITKFPFPKESKDKEGDILVWNFPNEDQKFGVYYAGIDPVVEGTTTSSDSLFAIYIYKAVVYKESAKILEDGTIKSSNSLEGDHIAACWVGRFDDINKTNERAELLVEWFNALTVCENNVTSFIQHMIKNRKQKYLARKDDLPFLKEIQANRSVFQEYGVKMTPIVKTFILTNMIDYLKEEIGVIHKNDGSELRKVLGAERIPDKMLLTEMLAYHDKLNVDRLIAFGLVLALVKSRESNGIIVKEKAEQTKKTVQVNASIDRNPFRNVGKSNTRGFRNLK